MKIEDAVRSIQEGSRYLDTIYDLQKTYTILVGPTGAGKSTLANVLLGNKIRQVTLDNGKKVFVVDRESGVRIGHANKSETDLPNIQKDYIDCPGFGDTDPARELQNAVYVQRVFGGKGQKVIIVVEYSTIFSGKAQGFIKLLHQVNNSTGDKFLGFAKQFGLCVSKVPSDEYDRRITEDPSKIAGVIHSELESAGDGRALQLFDSLGDRVIFFMKNDSYDSISTKLKKLIPKLQFVKIPIYPALTLEGEKAIEAMIEDVFGKIIESDRAAITRYIEDAKGAIKMRDDSTCNSILGNLEKYGGKVKFFKDEKAEISSSHDMRELIKALQKFEAEAREILPLSTERLDGVGTISDIYRKSNELSDIYKLRITSLIDPVIELEDKVSHLLKDLEDMGREWHDLGKLTTTSTGTKIAFAVGGGILVLGAIVGTGGAALVVAGGAAITAGIVAGGVLGAGALGLAAKKASDACNAYEENHKEVVPHTEKLKALYKKMPITFAKLWLSSQAPEKSEYLRDFQVKLLGEGEDDFSAEYNDILL